jgi:hypothetical protein
MRRTDRRAFGALVGAAAIAAAPMVARLTAQAHAPAARGSPAAAWTAPRTAWGVPDFDGVWNYATMTPLERPREFADKDVLSAAEAAAYERRTTDRQANANNTAGPDWWDPGTTHLAGGRTSLIVDPADGRLPPLTPEAQKAAAARAQTRRRGPAEGPEDLALKERCLAWETAGPPMMPAVYNNNVQFIQTKNDVVIVNEMIHEARIIPMDGRPHGTLRRWMGDSRGHWEGATLVVETINFTDKTSVRGSDDHLHLTERFTRLGPETIEYRFTMDDATVWTRAWTAAIPLTRTSEPMYEYACHEGNARSVEGILRGARVQDAPPR